MSFVTHVQTHCLSSPAWLKGPVSLTPGSATWA
jgi:hypothetical protein